MRLDELFNVSGAGMKAQMMRMEVVSANIANVNATRTPEGGPYRRRDVVFESAPVGGGFADALANQGGAPLQGVAVSKVTEDPSPFLRKYEPEHPDAGPDGYVLYPNVNIVSEMVNLQEASRSYEANLSVILSIKNMIAKTFEIGR
jgi:flagellar basal-body rod protein FlgC